MNIGIIGAGLVSKTMAETIKNVDYATNYAIASRDINKAILNIKIESEPINNNTITGNIVVNDE